MVGGKTVFVEPLVPIADKFNSLALIEQDCPKSGSKQGIIDLQLDTTHTCSGEKCAAFTFNQLAFTDASTPSANPTLSFHLNCTISLGTSKTCSGRRRRQADGNSGEQVSVSFGVDADSRLKPVSRNRPHLIMNVMVALWSNRRLFLQEIFLTTLVFYLWRNRQYQIYSLTNWFTLLINEN